MALLVPEGTTIGIATTWLQGDYWIRIISGAADGLRSQGVVPLCFALTGTRSPGPEALRAFYELASADCLSGIIGVVSALHDDDIQGFFGARSRLASVCVGSWIPGVPSLWIQNASGIRLLMQHLVDVCGRRRIAFVRGRSTNCEAEARFRAWEDYCCEHCLDCGPELAEEGDFSEASGKAATLKLLAKNGTARPDAIVAANDRMAIGVLQALKSRGLRVPQDVSVAGFDDLEAETADPPLTTVRQPVYEMGYQAAETIIARICGQKVPEEQMFAPELVVRSSCCPGMTPWTRRQPATCPGVRVFIERAHPTHESILAALYDEPLEDDGDSEARSRRSDLVAKLADSLERGDHRERALERALKLARSHAVRRLCQLLTGANGLEHVRGSLADLLPLVGVDSLTVATIAQEQAFRGPARIVLDYRPDQAIAIGATGDQVPCSQIIAAHARRPGSTVRLVAPLLEGDRPFGFLMLSGSLLQSDAVQQLATALAGAVLRAG